MTFVESFLGELEREAVTTRKMLALVPLAKFNWQPHTKSMTLIRLATHIAELPEWVNMVLHTTELDFSNNPYTPEVINSTEELLAYFERSLENGRKALQEATDADLWPEWILRNGEEIYSSSSKKDFIRISLSQLIHHRAQLGVYLRLLDIPIPGSYGPSADDQTM
ncbi:DinB family protein [Sediminibacterium ginsengisoli]|uniref:Uncharacterized damage-inducible protein DinB (Forms a four-helix bundle) n=1 Tax=Sediminibacterium ginsengisoli TaxID=413434 RepID=A0A1T4KZ02_9BACT|nr:DinB family protein [Sediminibacterium ginsengisoli]SJZ47695.1 Uncharacterized damage-inducible protein DinB (forms a four-helix bundle) [Sediminibacterium ginsengisoli]